MSRPLTITAYGNAQVDNDSAGIYIGGTGSLQLDGVGDYLETTGLNVAATSNFTIECWINFSQLPQDAPQPDNVQYLLSSTTADFKSISFENFGGTIRCLLYLENSANQFYLERYDLSISQDTFYHIAVVKNSTTIDFYLDGVAQTPAQTSGTMTTDKTMLDGDIFLGRWYTGGLYPFYFKGHVDELEINSTAKYTGNFTPPTRASTNGTTGVLTVRFDGTDGSTDFEDYIGEQGSATLTAFDNFTATANPNPSMVFLGNDQYTWADTNTWDAFLNYHDGWLQPEIVSAEFGLDATATSAIFGQLQTQTIFGLDVKGGVILPAESALDIEFTTDIFAGVTRQDNPTLSSEFNSIILGERLPGGQAQLDIEFQSSATGNTELNGSVQLHTDTTITATGRILKLADIFIQPFATLDATAAVDLDGRATMSIEFNAQTQGGLLVQVDEPYDYTWDDVLTWDEFIQDRWGPQGFLAFNNINLSASGEKSSAISLQLETEFNCIAEGGLLQDGSAGLDVEFTLESQAKTIQPGESLLPASFALAVDAGLFKPGQALLQSQFDTDITAGIILDASAELSDLLEFQIAAGVIKQDTVEITMTFAVTATGNTTLDGKAQLDAEFTQTASADRLVNAQARLDVFSFQLSDGISNPAILAQATLDSQFGTDIQGGLILETQAALDSDFKVEAFGGGVLNASSELSAFGFIVSDSRISNVRGESTLDVEFAVDINAGRILNAESELSAFGFIVSDSRISNVRGTATLDSSFEFQAVANVDIDGRATLSAFAFLVSDSRISDVRGTATLTAVFGSDFQGDLRLLESGNIILIKSETRNLLVKSETRILPILS